MLDVIHKELREDCRPLHAEPLHQGAELPRQAVIQKGLSTFRNTFTLLSLADSDLKSLLKDKDYYDKTISKLLNFSTPIQHKLKDIMLKKLKQIKVLDPAIGSGAFPMGVLHELVDLRRHLGDTTDLVQLKKEIIENSIYGIDIKPSAVEDNAHEDLFAVLRGYKLTIFNLRVHHNDMEVYRQELKNATQTVEDFKEIVNSDNM